MNRPRPLRPDRLRTIEKPFAWIPFRLLKDGLFAKLDDRSKLLYLFLCLAADRQGLSFYGKAKMQTYFQLAPQEIDLAIQELIQKDMIAYDGHLYQVLSLPINDNNKPQYANPAPERRTDEPERFGDVLKRLAREYR